MPSLLSGPEPSSCICLACYREAQRTHPAHFIPKWKKNSGIVPKCVYPDCLTSPSNKFISPTFATVSELEELIHINVSGEQPLLLCNDHYQYVYREFNSPTTCSSCGIKPKSGKRFHRHCPDVDLVNSLLCGEEEITDNDVICLSCYRVHLEMCKSSADPQNGSNDQLVNYISI